MFVSCKDKIFLTYTQQMKRRKVSSELHFCEVERRETFAWQVKAAFLQAEKAYLSLQKGLFCNARRPVLPRKQRSVVNPLACNGLQEKPKDRTYEALAKNG